jgi:hypothetical protein
VSIAEEVLQTRGLSVTFEEKNYKNDQGSYIFGAVPGEKIDIYLYPDTAEIFKNEKEELHLEEWDCETPAEFLDMFSQKLAQVANAA